MYTRLKFLGLAVFFAMVTFMGAAFIADGSPLARWWVTAIAGVVLCLCSLVGVVRPDKMKWLLDEWNKKNGFE